MEQLKRMHVAKEFLRTLSLRCFLSKKQLLEAEQFDVFLSLI